NHLTDNGGTHGVVVAFTPPSPASSPGDASPGTTPTTVDEHKTVTLAPGRYGVITVKDHATLQLTGDVYEAPDLVLGSHSSLVATQPSSLRLSRHLSVGDDRSIAPSTSSVAVNLEIDVLGTDLVPPTSTDAAALAAAQPAAFIGDHSNVAAFFSVPNGTLS